MDDKIRDAVIRRITAGRKKKVEMEELSVKIRSLNLGLLSDFELNKRLLKILEQLVEQGRLRLPPEKGWNKATGLPPFVYALRPEEDAAKRDKKQRINELRNKISWDPKMAPFAYKLTKERELHLAKKINDYLLTCKPDEPELPHRERALRIFNDEKALDGYLHSGLFNGKITLKHLNCFYCPEPLPFHSFSLDRRETKGKPLLVVENANTYWSCCQTNETLHAFAAVVYGRGKAIAASEQACDGLSDIRHRVEGKEIFYFGDLDPEGIDIPSTINKRRYEMELPPITAARELYRALLGKKWTTPCKPSQHKKHDPHLARQWLGKELADRYLQKAPRKGWPQEGLTAIDIVNCWK